MQVNSTTSPYSSGAEFAIQAEIAPRLGRSQVERAIDTLAVQDAFVMVQGLPSKLFQTGDGDSQEMIPTRQRQVPTVADRLGQPDFVMPRLI